MNFKSRTLSVCLAAVCTKTCCPAVHRSQLLPLRASEGQLGEFVLVMLKPAREEQWSSLGGRYAETSLGCEAAVRAVAESTTSKSWVFK